MLLSDPYLDKALPNTSNRRPMNSYSAKQRVYPPSLRPFLA